jgi:hypothetical protein
MKKIVVLFALGIVMLSSTAAFSQCAMCKRAAETNYKSQKNSTATPGRSLNRGIIYLLSVPYLIGAVGAFVWYRNRRKEN